MILVVRQAVMCERGAFVLESLYCIEEASLTVCWRGLFNTLLERSVIRETGTLVLESLYCTEEAQPVLESFYCIEEAECVRAVLES